VPSDISTTLLSIATEAEAEKGRRKALRRADAAAKQALEDATAALDDWVDQLQPEHLQSNSGVVLGNAGASVAAGTRSQRRARGTGRENSAEGTDMTGTGTSDFPTARRHAETLKDGNIFVDMGCDTLILVMAVWAYCCARGLSGVTFLGVEILPVMVTVASMLNDNATRALRAAVGQRKSGRDDVQCRRKNLLAATTLACLGITSDAPTVLYAYNLG